MIKLAIEEGRALPKSILEAPLLDEVTGEYYRAFGKLSRARGFTSEGESLPITVEAMSCFAGHFGFDDFEDFFNVISDVDEAYLKIEVKRKAAARRKQESDKKRKDRHKNKGRK